MEFDETLRFWYPRVALDAWINFAFSLDENLRSDFRRSEKEEKRRKIKIKISLSYTLSHALRPFFLLFLLTYVFIILFYLFLFDLLLLLLLLLLLFSFSFFLNFLISFYCIINHVANCEPHIQVYVVCHVSPDTRCLEKREIPTVLEFDEIRLVN